MKLTKKTINALNILGHLLDNEKASSRDIASKYDMSLPFASLILGELTKKGIVSSKKGPGGGFKLVEGKLDTLTLRELLTALDEKTNQLKIESNSNPLTASVLTEMSEMVEGWLDETLIDQGDSLDFDI